MLELRPINSAILLLVALLVSTSSHSKVSETTDYHVAGLKLPASIKVDRWGVPHIRAQDHYDTFFVQGFNAARDRLWQIDTWRRRGLGELSSVFGEQYVAQDKAARLFLYRGDMYAEWLAYGNDAKRIAQAFTDGINAFVDLTGTHPDLLPPEFDLLKYKPAKWQADDVIRIRSNGLWRNVVTEVWRARLACEGKLELAGRWKKLEPTWTTQVPDGIDPCVIPQDVLDVYLLAKAPVRFSDQVTIALQDTPDHSLGSNNWVVTGDRTATGRPILADDPHRGHATPSLRYIAHLQGPGINVIGAGEPALPGISIGHNERIAFGLTIFPIDQEDLYVYEKQGEGYKYRNQQESFRLSTEKVKVRGAQTQDVQLKFTRHGPVIAETQTHAFAVRAAWLDPGMSPYFGSIEYMRAQNFRQFVSALNRWGAPSENQVYADIDGNIGYKPAGRFPVRRNWDGLLPVPGDGQYEWDGYFDMDVLPEEYNPSRGFTGTANSMNLPPDYPIDEYRIGFEWSSPWRYKRLWEVLSQDIEHTLDASLNLQRDYQSVFARQVLEKLPNIASQPGGELFKNWHGRLDADSSAAALWNIWLRHHLLDALGKLIIGDTEAPIGSLDTLTALELLDTNQGKDAALASLTSAYNHAKAILGDDAATWRWGDIHRIRFEHPLIHLASNKLAKQMAIPDYPRGGNANTTNNTGYRSGNFDVASGASFRMVVDVGNWDSAYATNAPGQSGDPRSPFYANLLENWATEGHFPLLYSDKAVEQETSFTIRLLPEPSASSPASRHQQP